MFVVNNSWIDDHLNKIRSYYKKVENFEEKYHIIEKIYKKCKYESLSEINQFFIKEICQLFKINANFLNSHTFTKNRYDNASQKLLDICIKRKANIYISGSRAKVYLDEKLFKENNVKLHWFDYGRSKEYQQLNANNFFNDLSIIDCIFNCGLDKNKFLNY